MRVTGSATIAAPPDRVFDALRDPAVLVAAIPGCSRMEEVGPDSYAMTISAGVAAVKGTYAGEVALAEPDPPHSFVLRARGQGAPGTVEATVTVRLSGDGGGTRVDYDAEAVVGGMIGGVGQRMLGTVARRTAGEFFSAVEQAITAPGSVTSGIAAGQDVRAGQGPSAGQGGAAGQGLRAGQAGAGRGVPEPGVRRVFEAPAVAAGAGKPESVAWAMTAAFSAGAVFSLAGIAIGYAMGRGVRRRAR